MRRNKLQRLLSERYTTGSRAYGPTRWLPGHPPHPWPPGVPAVGTTLANSGSRVAAVSVAMTRRDARRHVDDSVDLDDTIRSVLDVRVARTGKA